MRLYSIMLDFILANECLDLQYFTDKYQVSKRTIQGDLSYLMNIGDSKGFTLKNIRQKGYLLEINNTQRFDQFVDQLSNQQPQVPQGSMENIIAFIAIQKYYVSMEETALNFNINRSAVKGLLNEMDEFCRKYDCILEVKSHYGMRIVNTTPAFASMVMEMLQADNAILNDYISTHFPDFNDLYKTLIEQITKYEQKINYNELKKIYVWLKAVTLQASLTDTKPGRFPQKDTVLDKIATDLLSQLQTRWQIGFPLWVYEELIQVLRTNIRIKDPSLQIHLHLKEDMEDFLEIIDKRYGTKFEDDESFKKMLLEHLYLLVSRSHQKISYKNSLLDEICIRYPLVFNVAIEFSNMLKSKYGITVTQDEAAFIATHFAGHMEKEKQEKLQRFDRIAVVCSSGGACAMLLKLQLQSIFPPSHIQTFSFLNMEELEEYKPDIIFTIMPLTRSFDIPIVYIHELLEPEDLAAIRQFLSYDCLSQFQLEDSFSKYDSLFKRMYFQARSTSDYKTLIAEMADQLIEDGMVEPEYKDKVLEREKYMSTVFFNGIALPHPIQLCARESIISVCILKEPLMEKDREVRCVFLIALKKEEYGKYENITKLFYQLMQNSYTSKRLAAARSFEQMRLILKETEASIS